MCSIERSIVKLRLLFLLLAVVLCVFEGGEEEEEGCCNILVFWTVFFSFDLSRVT